MGWVENTSSQTADDILVRVTTYDEGGVEVASTEFRPSSKRLAPSEKVPFWVSVAPVQGSGNPPVKATAEVVRATSAEGTDPYLWTSKYDLQTTYKGIGLDAVVKAKAGEVSNLDIAPMVVIYDESHKVVGVYAPVARDGEMIEPLKTSEDGNSLNFRVDYFVGATGESGAKPYTTELFVAPRQ